MSAAPEPYERSQRWLLRGLGILGAVLLLLLPLTWLDFDPDPLRLALVVSLSLLAYWTILDALLEPAPPWWVHRANQVTPVGADQRLGRYANIVEDHLTAQRPNEAVRFQLTRLASSAVWQHHGLTLDDPRVADVLGDQVLSMLRTPDRPFTLAELQQVVSALEGLTTVDLPAPGRKEPDAPAAPAR